MFRDAIFEKLGDGVLRMNLVERKQSKLLEHEVHCLVDFKINGEEVEIIHLHNFYMKTKKYEEIESYFYLKYPSYIIEINSNSKKYLIDRYKYTGGCPFLSHSFLAIDKSSVDSRIHSDVKKLILEHYNKTSQTLKT